MIYVYFQYAILHILTYIGDIQWFPPIFNTQFYVFLRILSRFNYFHLFSIRNFTYFYVSYQDSIIPAYFQYAILHIFTYLVKIQLFPPVFNTQFYVFLRILSRFNYSRLFSIRNFTYFYVSYQDSIIFAYFQYTILCIFTYFPFFSASFCAAIFFWKSTIGAKGPNLCWISGNESA